MQNLIEAVKQNKPDVLSQEIKRFTQTQKVSALNSICDNSGQKLVAIACRAQNNACLKVLLETGLDPNIRTKENLTPLHVCSQVGNTSGATLLINAGADINALVLGANRDKDQNAACIAYHHKHLDLLRILLKNKANPSLIIKEACESQDIAGLFVVLYFLENKKLNDTQLKLITPLRHDIWRFIQTNYNAPEDVHMKCSIYTKVLNSDTTFGSLFKLEAYFWSENNYHRQAKKYLFAQDLFGKRTIARDLCRYTDYGTFTMPMPTQQP